MNTRQINQLILLGQNIRKYRELKGWSQEDLAFEIGLHRNYIGGIERGERNLTILNLIKIEEKLNFTLYKHYLVTYNLINSRIAIDYNNKCKHNNFIDDILIYNYEKLYSY